MASLKPQKGHSRKELTSALSIGERLRLTRLALGLTQKSMAYPLSVSREAYTMYETGSREPPWTVAVELCDSWGITMDWIYRGEMSNLPSGLLQKIVEQIPKARVRVS